MATNGGPGMAGIEFIIGWTGKGRGLVAVTRGATVHFPNCVTIRECSLRQNTKGSTGVYVLSSSAEVFSMAPWWRPFKVHYQQR